MTHKHLLRRFAAFALVTMAAGVGAVAAQAEEIYFGTVPSGKIYKMSTVNPSADPVLVTDALPPVKFQGLVGTCSTLYALLPEKIVSIDLATGATADVATGLGASSSSLVLSADGTRLWWVDSPKVYTRLVSDPPTAAPTEITTVTAGPSFLMARVGDLLVHRSNSGWQTFAAAAGPTTVTLDTSDYGTDRTYITGNATRAFIEVGALGSGYTIKAIDPAVDAAVDLATSATAPGVMLAFDSNLWVFNGQGGAADNVWNVPITDAPGSLALTADNKINGAALPGFVQAATRACPKAPAPAVSAPVVTAMPTISGTTALRSTLTGTNGTWSHDPTAYTYQWERCTVGDSSSCVAITGATGVTRVLQRGDVGKALRLAVTASNPGGQATAHSALTAEVTAGSLKIFPTRGVSANPVLLLRIPGPGIVTLTGTRKVSSGSRATSGNAACKTVVRRVAKGGLVRLICRPTAATQAARYAGRTVTVRLRAVYRPNKGKVQIATRVVVFRPLRGPEPVTG